MSECKGSLLKAQKKRKVINLYPLKVRQVVEISNLERRGIMCKHRRGRLNNCKLIYISSLVFNFCS